MKNKKLKKGFTVKELVVTVAIVVVLVVILVPAFVSVINKTKISPDEQAVYQMNAVLEADEAKNGKPETFRAMMSVLASADINPEGRTPFNAGYEFYWDSVANRVYLYEIATQTIAYPAENAAHFDAVPSTWYGFSTYRSD